MQCHCHGGAAIIFTGFEIFADFGIFLGVLIQLQLAPIGQMHREGQIFKLCVEQGLVGKDRCGGTKEMDVPLLQKFRIVRVIIAFGLRANPGEDLRHPGICKTEMPSVKPVEFLCHGQILLVIAHGDHDVGGIAAVFRLQQLIAEISRVDFRRYKFDSGLIPQTGTLSVKFLPTGIAVPVVDPDLQRVSGDLTCPIDGFQHPHTGSATAHNGHGNGIAVAFGVIQGVVVYQMIAKQSNLVHAAQLDAGVLAFGFDNTFQKIHVGAAFHKGINDDGGMLLIGMFGNQLLCQMDITVLVDRDQAEFIGLKPTVECQIVTGDVQNHGTCLFRFNNCRFVCVFAVAEYQGLFLRLGTDALGKGKGVFIDLREYIALGRTLQQEADFLSRISEKGQNET